jgi:hypothetical protein
MKRILLLVTVALVMAAMMVATAAPALSQQPPPPQAAGPNCESGQALAASNAPNADLQDQHLENQTDCVNGDAPGEGFD